VSEIRDIEGVRVALHACCGPCLLEPIDALRERGASLTVVYANSNIAPAEEYVRRRDTLLGYAAEQGIPVVELAYAPRSWGTAVADAPQRPERCRACYRLRLGETARWASENGFEAMATTLTVSPYQDAEGIRVEGEAAAKAAGIAYVGSDFRERYPEATRRSRELGMYRQNYCGCLASRDEAQAERGARRAARTAEKSR
jgi:predicted adenine nucleotide alpha hydrolase (AANH) superfamily ATPase